MGRIALWAGIGAIVGGLIGLLLGALAPGVYLNWFDAEYVERFGAVWLGIFLGVQQGAGLGALVGLATVVLPWLNRKTAANLKVSASYDATTGTVKIVNAGRVPVLVFGVWAFREVAACCLFSEPLLVIEGSKEVTGSDWRGSDGEAVGQPRSGPLAVLATGPTINS